MLDVHALFNESILTFEMYFAKVIEPQLLCDAIAKHLFLRRENIGVVELTKIDTKETAVVIEDLGGDFPFSVHIHTELTWLIMTEPELAQRLCTTLGTECLIAKENDSPYTWLLVTAKDIKSVQVDPELFDGQCLLQLKADHQ
jgi:hypothetical protein